MSGWIAEADARREPRTTRGRGPASLGACLVGAAALFTGCEPPSDVLTVGPDGRAVIRHDAGVVLVGGGADGRVAHAFTLHNPSEAEPARLTLLSETCGCAAADDTPDAIPPGGAAVLAVSYEAVGSGAQRQAVTYATGLAEPSSVTLELVATALRRIEIEGGGELSAAVPPGRTREIGLTVLTHRPTDEPDAPVTLAADSPLLSVVDSYPLAAGTVPGDDGRSYRMTRTHFVCRLLGDGAAETDWGADRTTLRLTATQGAVGDDTLLKLRTEHAVTVDPPRLVFYEGRGDREAGLTLTADRPFRVTGVSGADGLVAADPSPGAEESAEAGVRTVAVRLADDAAAGGSRRVVLVVATDHPRQPRVRVPVALVVPGGGATP